MYLICIKYVQNFLTGQQDGQGSHYNFFSLKSNMYIHYTYSGKVGKIQVTGPSRFCWRACQNSGEQYCLFPLDLIGLNNKK